MAMTDRSVSVVGLGSIGGGMAQRLLDAGFRVTVYNRTPAKAAELVAAGARRVESAAEAAGSDTVLLSLSDEEAVESVLFGQMVDQLSPGAVLIDTSTVSPGYARDAASRLGRHGVRRVEACLIGNPEMARAGELRVFVAGEPADIAAARDVLDALGRHGILELGPPGRASALKLAFNLLLGVQTVALSEAVSFAEAGGLDRDLLLTAIMKSGWRSPMLNFRAEFMRTRRYEPAGFRAALMAKDLQLALQEAGAGGLDLPLTGRAAQRYAQVIAAGRGDKDAAVVVERLAGDGHRKAPSPAGAGPAAEQPAPTPYEYLRLGTAFCGSKILLTALELGLFRLLADGPLSEPQVRERLGLHPRGSRDFLDALAAFGLLVRSGGGYANSTGAHRYLIAGRPEYVGGFLERANQMLYPAWGRFTEALRTGEPQSEFSDAEPYDRMSKDPEQLRSFLGMMDTMNGPLGPELARALPWAEYESVVDVGGARGNLLAALTRAHPHLKATVFDLPEVAPFFDEHMAALGQAGQVRFQPGNFFTDPLPGADVVVLGHVLHDWAPRERIRLVEKAYHALPPGGLLAVYDPMLDELRPSAMNLVISLDMLLTTRGGAEYTPAECRDWLSAAGCTDLTAVRLGFADTLVSGRKPR
jgi:3-hydroxyisobutyrate dehydrogenase-like beta-hydroxyacid dehydrogenase/SAM-dependent methyltransferase